MKPCPFCGSEKLEVCHENNRDWYGSWIICNNCHAKGPSTTMHLGLELSKEELEKDATALWSRRAKERI